MSVTYPRGFRASGISAGLKPSGRPDLGLVVADAGSTVAGLFTTNRVAAAPVVVGRERLATVTLGDGPARSRVLGCDLSYEYVRINGEYTT